MSSAEDSPAAPRQRPWTLAARLTTWYAVALFATTLAATTFLYWSLASGVARQSDQYLHNKVHAMRVLLLAEPNDAAAIAREVAEDVDGPRQAYIRVLETGGPSLYEPPDMAVELAPQSFPAPQAMLANGQQAGSEIRGHSGKPFRALSFLVERSGQAGPAPVVIQAAVDTSADAALLAGYRQRLALVLLAALLVSVPIGYQVARAGLRPLRRIIRTTGGIRTATLHERVTPKGLPAELHDLAVTVNLMLDRLEASFGRLRRFSDDIAHELRTPVQGILGGAEVALGRARTVEEYREVLESILEDADRMSRTVQSLLFLARSESPATEIELENVAIAHELGLIRDFYEAAASEAGVALEVTAEPVGLVAMVDRTLFQRAVGNLVANALAHTPAGGAIRVAARHYGGGGILVEVVDTGRGIAQEHLPHVFDRFYRADHTRTTAGDNLGLGLPIVKGIVALHGGDVAVESKPGAGTRVVLRFPFPGMPTPPGTIGGAAARPYSDDFRAGTCSTTTPDRPSMRTTGTGGSRRHG